MSIPSTPAAPASTPSTHSLPTHGPPLNSHLRRAP
ncbi:hypothetical protein SNOG_06596 [Parastagonospora nodorum SN15]|uniref:Uncharacterized protein n=1 Tax=Phaeosphaeria nodorum (strain SN15 / ATCC MYA-4574 / FGSC 10173) TaxID=321614 RepID=Q0UNR8_PHANO|nr:hypothetical protein SNOG_06596 [Parastagonospora nodorum SN15]EAT86427.1 hypothetical protein SNOG_06596 [Parastagonospora nodorum SN15]